MAVLPFTSSMPVIVTLSWGREKDSLAAERTSLANHVRRLEEAVTGEPSSTSWETLDEPARRLCVNELVTALREERQAHQQV
jgi:hypothetical protein